MDVLADAHLPIRLQLCSLEMYDMGWLIASNGIWNTDKPRIVMS